MRRLVHRGWLAFAFIAAAFFTPEQLLAQAQADTAAAARKADAEEVTAEEFTATLKQVWSFLKAETEAYLESVSTKGEFETSADFERRVTDARRQYYSKIVTYSRDQKLDKSFYWIPFKALLKSYDADAQVYRVESVGQIDAPYNIEAVQCEVPSNPYLALADSIKMGYRASILYLKFRPDFKWSAAPDEARAAKTDEDGVIFRVKVRIDIESPDVTKRAILEIVPKEIQLMNTKTHQVYWQRSL